MKVREKISGHFVYDMSYEVSNKDANAIAVNPNDAGSHGLRRGTRGRVNGCVF